MRSRGSHTKFDKNLHEISHNFNIMNQSITRSAVARLLPLVADNLQASVAAIFFFLFPLEKISERMNLSPDLACLHNQCIKLPCKISINQISQ